MGTEGGSEQAAVVPGEGYCREVWPPKLILVEC
jgi:hypothetical protein